MNVLTLIVSLVPLGVLALAIREAHRRRHTVYAIVLYMTLVHECLLVVYPVWYDVITNYSLEREMVAAITPVLLTRIVLGEAAFVCSFAVAVCWGMRTVRPVERGNLEKSRPEEMIVLGIILTAGIIIFAVQIMQPVMDYETYTHFAEIQTSENIGEMVYGWFRGVMWFPALTAACLLLPSRSCGRTFRVMAAGIVVLMVLYGLATGYRGRIVWVVSLMTVGVVLSRRWWVLACLAVVLGAFLPMAQYMAGEWRSVTENQLGGESQLTAINRLLDEIKGGDALSGGNEDFLRMVAKRAQGPRNSGVLYLLKDDGNGAGIKPIWSSLCVIVPRILWENKGVGGSTDGTSYGSGIFLVRRLGYDAPLFNMGPILASGHAYWEGGWAWVVGAGFATGLLWNAVMNWSMRRGRYLGALYCLSMAAALPIDGLFTALVPVYAFILKVLTSLIALIALEAIVKVASIRRRSRKRVLHCADAVNGLE